MSRLALENAERLTASHERHQSRTREMTRDHNSKIQHLALKISEKKAEYERLQEEHDELFKKMKREHEAKKSQKEEGLRAKREQLLSELGDIGRERRRLDAEFEAEERELETRCVDDYLRMNWRNEKGELTRGAAAGAGARGEEEGGGAGEAGLRGAGGAAQEGGGGDQRGQQEDQGRDGPERAAAEGQVA